MKKVFTEEDIIRLKKEGNRIVVAGKSDIFTPSALDKIRDFHLSIKKIGVGISEVADRGINSPQIIAIGGDHTGFKVKAMIAKFMSSKGFQIKDVGTFSEQSCDYPDFAYAVAQKVVTQREFHQPLLPIKYPEFVQQLVTTSFLPRALVSTITAMF
mgnify:CR=1 FL=1